MVKNANSKIFGLVLIASLIIPTYSLSVNFAFAQDVTTTPLEQIKSGVTPQDVQCRQGLELVIKATDGSPACVSITTKDILVYREWAKSEGFGAKVEGGPPGEILGQPPEKTFVPNVLIIKFNDDVPDSDHAAKLQGTGAEIVDSIPQIHVRILKVPDQAMEGIMNSLSHIPGVEYVEQDTEYSPEYTPNDQYFTKQYALSKINAAAVWDINKGDSAVIAMGDTGFDLSHPELASKYVLESGYNAYGDSTNFGYTTCGHGTMTSGVAAAQGDNTAGIAGLAMNAKIIPIKVVSATSTTCSTSTSVLAKAITYAADKGARVINLSFGVGAGDNTITTAAQYMYNKGGWVVTAAGNSNAYISSADNPYIITVGATDSNDQRWASTTSTTTGSNYGPFVDFVAPGAGIYVTTVNGGYGSTSGTSFAAPEVSALIALMFSQDPTLTPIKVFTILRDTAVDLGAPGLDDYYGWGRIDAGKALQQVGGIISISPSSTTTTTTTTAPPSAPVISTSSTTTNNKTPTISGTAAASSTVKIYDGTTLVGTVTAAADGSWSAATSALADGTHSITATATDSAGSTSAASNAASITVDSTAPAAPVITTSSGLTNNKTPTISGTAEAGSTVSVYDGASMIGTATATGGSWSITSPALSDGTHTITATATDLVGNTSVASNAISIGIDATAPTAPAITTPSGTITTSTTTISGTAETDSSIKVYDGTTLLGTVTAVAGSWSLTTPALADGTHSITATATDAAGNTSAASSAVSITVSTATTSSTTSSSTPPPTTTTPADTTKPTVSITSPADGVSIKYGFTISVSASDDTGVTKTEIYVDGKLVTTSTSSSASYTYTTKGDNAYHTISAKAYDAAGNIGSAAISVKITMK